MPPTRRDLLTLLSATSALTALGSWGPRALSESRSIPSTNHSSDQSGGNPPPIETDQATYDFWSRDIRNPGFSKTRSLDGESAPRATFVYYDKHDGFVTGSDIGDVGLPDHGDVNVIVNVDHIHLSLTDQSRFVKLEGGSLRIDLQQADPLPLLAERLAWTSIAGFLPEDKKLPPQKDMNFNPGATWGKLQSVPLPGGGGRWTWNFFLQHRKSRWMQLFELLRRDKNLLLPIYGLGLPAIALTALDTVDNIVAELTKDANTDWLFQSPDVFVYATKNARDKFEGSKLRLKQGMYVVVPSNQIASFAKQSTGLEIKDGLLVPKNTRSLDVFEAAKQTLPELTYLTVGVTARMTPTPK
jgi:hypothetical protein